jgi:hypothetical protein
MGSPSRTVRECSGRRRLAVEEESPRALQGRLVYDLYDEWKKECGGGRLVGLDELIHWCGQPARAGAEQT